MAAAHRGGNLKAQILDEGNGKMQANTDVIRALYSAFASATQQLPCAFISWLQWSDQVLDRSATNAHKTAGRRCHELAASHDPFVTDPALRGSCMKR
jgi:hypothetical protein